MGSPAEFTILVLLVAVGGGLWTVYDRLAQVQRDVEALNHGLGADERPEA